jgi:hypothetical protein
VLRILDDRPGHELGHILAVPFADVEQWIFGDGTDVVVPRFVGQVEVGVAEELVVDDLGGPDEGLGVEGDLAGEVRLNGVVLNTALTNSGCIAGGARALAGSAFFWDDIWVEAGLATALTSIEGGGTEAAGARVDKSVGAAGAGRIASRACGAVEAFEESVGAGAGSVVENRESSWAGQTGGGVGASGTRGVAWQTAASGDVEPGGANTLSSNHWLVRSAGEALWCEWSVTSKAAWVASEAGAGEGVQEESSVTFASLVDGEGGIWSAGSTEVVGIAGVTGGWAVVAEPVCVHVESARASAFVAEGGCDEGDVVSVAGEAVGERVAGALFAWWMAGAACSGAVLEVSVVTSANPVWLKGRVGMAFSATSVEGAVAIEAGSVAGNAVAVHLVEVIVAGASVVWSQDGVQLAVRAVVEELSVTCWAADVAGGEGTVAVRVELESGVASASFVRLEGGVALARCAAKCAGWWASGTSVGAVEAKSVSINDESSDTSACFVDLAVSRVDSAAQTAGTELVGTSGTRSVAWLAISKVVSPESIVASAFSAEPACVALARWASVKERGGAGVAGDVATLNDAVSETVWDESVVAITWAHVRHDRSPQARVRFAGKARSGQGVGAGVASWMASGRDTISSALLESESRTASAYRRISVNDEISVQFAGLAVGVGTSEAGVARDLACDAEAGNWVEVSVGWAQAGSVAQRHQVVLAGETVGGPGSVTGAASGMAR